jgi:hypothetical protein
MRYFFGAILLVSLLPTGSASAHHTRHNKWHPNPLGHHRTHHFVDPGGLYPIPLLTDRNDPYGVGRAAVCCI